MCDRASRTTSHRSALVRGLLTTTAAIALVGASSLSASADESAGTTVGNVSVGASILLTGMTPSFTLNGLSGATVTSVAGVVSMNVKTNNFAGYDVTVQAETDTLVATDPDNDDSIPIGALKVRETGESAWSAMTDATPLTVHSQGARSAEVGDTVRNDYQVQIPFVATDTYSVTLDYVATTL